MIKNDTLQPKTTIDNIEELDAIDIPLENFFLTTAFAFLLILISVKISVEIIQFFCVKDILWKGIVGGILAYLLPLLVAIKFCPTTLPSVNPIDVAEKFIKGIVSFCEMIFSALVANFIWLMFLSAIVIFVENIFKINFTFFFEQQEIIGLIRNNTVSIWQLIGVVVMTSIFAPIVEELYFRYFLYRFLKGYVSRSMAIIFSALIFSIFHQNISAFAGLFVVGILLAIFYEKYKNLWPSIIAHGLFNLFSVFATLTFNNS